MVTLKQPTLALQINQPTGLQGFKPVKEMNPMLPAPHDDKWGKWECPVCGEICNDPESIYQTVCHNNHTVSLGPVLENGWRQTFDVNS